MKSFGSVATLMALWLLMSGLYKPMLIGFGVASVLLVMVIVRRMDRIDRDHLDVLLSPFKSLTYFSWLLVEIAKSNWAVTKVVLSPKMAVRQHMFSVPYSQKSDLAQVIFANSITLTPGTISVETERKTFLVHALVYGPNDEIELAEMDRRVTAIETGTL